MVVLGLAPLTFDLHVNRSVRDPRAYYKQSMSVLEHAKKFRPDVITKTSLMVGLGEKDDEVVKVMEGQSEVIISFGEILHN